MSESSADTNVQHRVKGNGISWQKFTGDSEWNYKCRNSWHIKHSKSWTHLVWKLNSYPLIYKGKRWLQSRCLKTSSNRQETGRPNGKVTSTWITSNNLDTIIHYRQVVNTIENSIKSDLQESTDAYLSLIHYMLEGNYYSDVGVIMRKILVSIQHWRYTALTNRYTFTQILNDTPILGEWRG